MARGRPFEPGNSFGRGRPKGSPNKKSLQAQKLFEDNSPAIMALAINRCKEDHLLLRMLASRIVGRACPSQLKLGRLPCKTLQDLDRASEVTIQKATSGKLFLDEAAAISNLIEKRRRVIETEELERRIRTLENPKGNDVAA